MARWLEHLGGIDPVVTRARIGGLLQACLDLPDPGLGARVLGRLPSPLPGLFIDQWSRELSGDAGHPRRHGRRVLARGFRRWRETSSRASRTRSATTGPSSARPNGKTGFTGCVTGSPRIASRPGLAWPGTRQRPGTAAFAVAARTRDDDDRARPAAARRAPLVLVLAGVAALGPAGPAIAAAAAPASTPVPVLVALSATHHRGYDQLVFTFSGALPRHSTARYVSRLPGGPVLSSGRRCPAAGDVLPRDRKGQPRAVRLRAGQPQLRPARRDAGGDRSPITGNRSASRSDWPGASVFACLPCPATGWP